MSIFIDWERNQNNIKGRLILIAFRLANKASHSKLFFILLLPHLIIYRVMVEWVLGVELPYKTKVGKGLIIYHGHSTVINDDSVIGENCIIRHNTTIGHKQLHNGEYSKGPVIGNNVDIGANVCIIGHIEIGDNVKIGAGSVIVKDVPRDAVVVGNPARVIKMLE